MTKDKSTQWHPLFADLLRPMLQDYYEVQTNVPVGDAPREADILLLRRTSDQPTPFRGLWRHLTTWNVLEFKGPTVSARLGDLHLLVELGLGIHRRLNQERHRQKKAPLEPEEASFWYVVRRLGRRFLPDARRRFGRLEEIESGLWRSQNLGHPVFFISSETFASEPDSVPLHLLLQRSPRQELELAHLVVEQPHFLEWYASFFSTLHPEAWTEVRQMARSKNQELKFDLSAVIEDIDMNKLIESGGLKRLMQNVGARKLVKEMGVDWLLASLPAEELKKLKDRLK
jgi:hypothetical protein